MTGESWGEKVTIVLHHVPESEDFEGGFEAATMTGVPHDVSVTGSDPDSAMDASNHLLAGFRAFGFTGRIAVEDFSEAGRTDRYEVQVGDN